MPGSVPNTAKQCRECRRGLSVNSFYRKSVSRDGLQPRCKECDFKRKARFRKGRRYLKLTGRRFGRLVVLRDAGIKDGRTMWACRCGCGNEAVMVGSSLVFGHVKSCGCLKLEAGNLNRLPRGEAARRGVFAKYKQEAVARNLDFSLTREQFVSLVESNCHYCGTTPSNLHARKFSNGEFSYNGIDRIDNSRGYFPSNCVPCCKACNYQEFLHF